MNHDKAWSILPTNSKRVLTLHVHGCVRSECVAGVEHSSTDANYLLRKNLYRIHRKYDLGLSKTILPQNYPTNKRQILFSGQR